MTGDPYVTISGQRLATMLDRYLRTLCEKLEFQDENGINMSERDMAAREITLFLNWLEDNDGPKAI